MEFSSAAKDMALAHAFMALVMSLRDSGALNSQNFLDNVAGARNRLVELGHTECVDAMDAMMEPVAQALGFEPQEQNQPRGGS